MIDRDHDGTLSRSEIILAIRKAAKNDPILMNKLTHWYLRLGLRVSKL